MAELVRFDADDSVGVITLDRPPVNAISADLVDALVGGIDAAADPSIRAVVVTGEPHFAAGADIKGFRSDLESGINPGRIAEGLSHALVRLEGLAKPVIAAVRGFAIGGGLELALACDFRFMGEGARVGQGEIALGIFPGAGGTQRLPRLVGMAVARDLIYTGRQVPAEEALEMGLADRVHPDDAVLDAAMDAARDFAQGPTLAIGAAKRVMNQGLGLAMDEALALETAAFAEVFESRDARDGVFAFTEKRPAHFTGS